MIAPAIATALREGLAGALVAAGLALPMLGFRLVDSSQGLSLGTRFDWVLWAALIVGLGRFAMTMLRGAWQPSQAPAMGEAKAARLRLMAGWALAGLAITLPFLPFSDRNLVDKATLVLIYVMLGWGLNIVVGLAGLLDLGFVAFYAVGAYSYALLATGLGWSFWLCLPLAGLFAAGFGIALGFPVLRLRGDYLAIVTLGFGEIIRVILQNWQDFTGGPSGISSIPRPTLFGLRFMASAPEGHQTFADYFGLAFSGDHRVIFLYFIILGLALLTNLFTLRIRRLPIGRAWEALREDEIACRSLGLNPTTIKLSAFALGAMFAGFAGSFFATRQGFISPESFSFIESAVILAIVVLGGMGSQIGVVLAALILVGLPEWFRELQQYRMIAFGGAMVLIMLWKPSGLLASRAPTIRLKGAK
ncbi:leucine/isoleucine/valine transporter subunit; membrane component of ABC superfamily [Magnetospirillum sp. LM-5]|uniref:high-affinity branched-chain amino acid ABC transporter permease LivM n=1 Tax=Magnetospirillum sp. LM-5 TaxID=2681466 RepID=UPI001380FD8B|nr:high-affinity branched-chain amino acid ABC transporter permease LivM [Magnetospirillum sp. LM-5]CAA7611860.1 leucine/isoleucine/valine transporter subunit; membrane component of ABC superfamily [Magnetospirillum sp. LM-5]